MYSGCDEGDSDEVLTRVRMRRPPPPPSPAPPVLMLLLLLLLLEVLRKVLHEAFAFFCCLGLAGGAAFAMDRRALR